LNACHPNFEPTSKMSQRATYYEEELDDADDLADVGLNLTIENYGQGGLYEDGSRPLVLEQAVCGT
jgi:hypothetical protein